MSKLLLTLRFYACGNMLITVGDFCGVHKSTASRIVKVVSEAIAGLRLEYIKFPQTAEEIAETQEHFYRIAAFPRVIGAIDCTHVKILSPGGDQAEDFRNRKGYFSFNVQTIADSKLRILDIVARWPGSAHDQTIFSNLTIKAKFDHGLMGNSVLVGDSGYTQSPYMIHVTPLRNPGLPEEVLFQEAQIRTRNVVERKYGVWKRRFPILALGLRLKLDRVQAVIVACAVLQNLAIQMKEIEPPENPMIQQELNVAIVEGQIRLPQLPGNIPHINGREPFIAYFNNLL